MSYIGIDLGTTFSVVAYLDELGVPRIIKNEHGENLTPSCVMNENGTMKVGLEASRLWSSTRSSDTPDEAAAMFKRAMGTDTAFSIKGEDFSPIQLSTFVLERMKAIANAEVSDITKAVVTIPANFAHEARDATMVAAQDAGLDVQYIINEPTAAALYYAYVEQEELHGKYAVYDLGGGTFDISVIEVNGNEVEVISSDGLHKLGGYDFDMALQELVKEKYEEETGKDFDPEGFNLKDAEEAKIALSRRKRVDAQIGRDFVDIRREDFEEAISSLLAQTEMCCEAAMDDAGIEPSDLKAVFMAGGSTRIPAFQESVSRVFGKEGISTANVDEVVALGAALYAAHKSDKKGLSAVQKRSLAKIQVAESSSMCFGTISLGYNENREGAELQNDVLIRKGDKIPTSVTKSYYTVAEGQTAVNCIITESRTPESNPKFVKEIWSGELQLPSGRPANQEVEVTFAYTENQIVCAAFKDVASGNIEDIELSMSGDSTGSDIDKFKV